MGGREGGGRGKGGRVVVKKLQLQSRTRRGGGGGTQNCNFTVDGTLGRDSLWELRNMNRCNYYKQTMESKHFLVPLIQKVFDVGC